MPGPDPCRAGAAVLGLTLAACAPTLMAACAGDDATEPSVATTLAIEPSSADLSSFGETVQLTATVRDQNGQPIAGVPVNWASDASSVATVNGTGLVTAVQNGSATVTAASGGVSGTAAITVAQRPARIDVSPSADTLVAIDETVQLAAQVYDANGNAVPNAGVAWSTDAAAVAIVDADGLVTATGNGDADITAAAGGASGTAEVTVSQVTVGLDVLPAATTLFSLGDTIRLVAVGIDANGHAAAALEVEWVSEHPAVASVDSAGLVTALRTGGSDVFASSGELRDSSGVTVAQLATEVRVAPAVDTLDAVGDTVRLSAVALDARGNEVLDTEYIWSAPHPAVVTVDDRGLVTAAGSGTGEIRVTATRAGANYIGVATITVRPPPSPVRRAREASQAGARDAPQAREVPQAGEKSPS